MAKINIPYFFVRPSGRYGLVRYYWEPSAALRRAGWKTMPLGADENMAIEAARAQNRKIEEWRDGGAVARQVKAFAKRDTLRQLIREYQADARFTRLRDSTRREYQSCIRTLEGWAGDEMIHHITRQRVQKLKAALLKPKTPGAEPSYARTRNVMAVLYNVFKFALDNDRISSNPAAEAGVPLAPPRNRVISLPAIEALVAAAEAKDQPQIGYAIRIAFDIMQREGDVLQLTEHNWRELEYDVDVAPEDWPKLVGPDGRVFGIQLRQRKTRKAIRVPVTTAMRATIEAVLAANRKRWPDRLGIPLVVDPENGDSYPDWKFQRRFRAVVEHARDRAAKENNRELLEDLADIQFRDLRRSGMVYYFEMGIPDHLIAAISGHTLERTKKILETYGPRNTRMASGAVAQSIVRLETRRSAQANRKKEKGS